MKIIYFSKGIRGIRCLEHILKAGYQVLAVVGVIQENGLDLLSRTYSFPILYFDQLNTKLTVNELETFEADIFILSGYNKILKKMIIDIPPLGTINLHGGKLPEYRGAAPINWQIINGEETGGCSIIYVDEGIDTGDIIAQEIYPITPQDTHNSVLEKTLTIFPPLLEKVLKQIEEGNIRAIKQDSKIGGYYPRRYPSDSQIDWQTMDDYQIHNLVRGMHGPYPAAFTFSREKKIEIDKTRLIDNPISGPPGQVAQTHGDNVIVLCRNRGIEVEQISVDGNSVSPSSILKPGDMMNKRIQEEGNR